MQKPGISLKNDSLSAKLDKKFNFALLIIRPENMPMSFLFKQYPMG